MQIKLHHKLIAVIVTVLVAVVGFLATYLSSRQIDSMASDLRRKATTYGRVMASGTKSAVAFSDRETAREVLSALTADSEVASVTLRGEGGVALYVLGRPQVKPTGSGLLITESRIAAITPVESVEGPRGVLVVELSTASLREARERVTRLAVIAGSAALLSGALIAWLLARRLARRLAAIADVATAVAAGDLSQRPIEDTGRDEIGMLAKAFNAMLRQIQHLVAHVREMARQDRDRLEGLVAERTAQLDRCNAEMRLVFDHVDQGLLIVDLHGHIAAERSAAVERWLGPIPTSGTLVDYVRAFAPLAADWFELQWETLRERAMPAELCLAQLPSRFEVGGRHLELTFQPLEDARGSLRVLVVATDITERMARDRAERDERETASLCARLLRSRGSFLAFHSEVTERVAELATGTLGSCELMRTVHTLKGIWALEGLLSLAEQCHALESAFEEGDELACNNLRTAIEERWKSLSSKLAPMLGATTGRVDVRDCDLLQVEAAIARGDDHAALADLVASWRHERVSCQLQRLADEARALAVFLGKDPLEVVVEADDDLRLDPHRWAAFWATMSHAIRNAIDHGIEPLDERLRAGKSGLARLTLRARREHGRLTVEVEDTGRGIDWVRLAKVARERQLPATTHRHLVDALFSDGVSTREVVSETSGRGIGLAALRAACESSGGCVSVHSIPSTGTTIAFEWSGLDLGSRYSSTETSTEMSCAS
ncbi:MAG: HAMP domain-containing protein [Kofleriaceae bacterium]